jgi:hypothetical protein
MYQLRHIARVVALMVALPLLSLGHWPDPLQGTLVTKFVPHSALALFIAAVVLGSAFFLWVNRKERASRRIYVLVGLVLGLFPAIFFSAVCAIENQAYPPVAVAFTGVLTGSLGGFLLWREFRSPRHG